MSWECECGITNNDNATRCAGCGWTKEQLAEYRQRSSEQRPRSTPPPPPPPPPTVAPMGKKVSLITFAAAVAVFLLPFMSVSCQGQKVHTFSGLEMAIGADVEQADMFSGAKKTEHVKANPLATLALLAAAAGATVTFLSKAESPLAGILGAAGAALLVMLKANVGTDMVNRSQGMAQVQSEFGFWAAILLLGAGALCSFGLLGRLLGGSATAAPVAILASNVGTPQPAVAPSGPGANCPACGYVFHGQFGPEGWWCPNCNRAHH
jgi:hypothetical protein